MIRRQLLRFATAALLAGPVPAQAHDRDELQRTFAEGAAYLQSGEFERATAVFRDLLRRTDSPRVKLELARALFHQEQYEEARTLFAQVSASPDTPWQVRDNIRHFIQEIDTATGYLRFSLSLVSDSNPQNLSSQREFTIGGVRLTMVPPDNSKPVTGVRYLAQGYRPLSDDRRVGGYVTAAYNDFPGGELDRLTVDAGISASLRESGDLRAKAGIEAGGFAGKYLYGFPYVSLMPVFHQSDRHRVSGELKTGRVDYPDYPHLDATYAGATLSGIRSVSPTVALLADGTAEFSRAREDPYSYHGLALTPGASVLLPGPALLVKTGLTLGMRRYDGVDPLFGQQRSDRRKRLDVSIAGKNWRWRDHTLTLVASVERNRSSVDFYSYRKINFSVVVE